ncbi:hypothetical protein DEFDS_2109 [Deferribacter desulfuricans SSM1]|uniref:Lipoprotein n=1 Tax=Deferribacter desulfuricans (strain DSM 14783 / JCM 11476 / NBRC 101012 / SSM1) TaxID=639282 RepID=D3PA17_DEFDS|nr:hypothetical protein [Deferribacter desulfuricans]BAI81557.1 hypothetical protein DEFDS_2109 [Deferribacter desulfuricans SSM1]
MQKNILRIYSLFIICTLIFFGCGKKTDPVPKSMFKIKMPSENQVVLAKDVIVIKNSSKDNLLYVYKSKDSKCINYQFLTTVLPGKEYVDKEVKYGDKVSYKLIYKHPDYRIFSDPLYVTKLFVKKPIVNVSQIIKVDGGVKIVFEKNDEVKFIVYGFSTDNLNKIVKNNEIYVEVNEPFNLYFQPVSKSNIRGDIKKVYVDKRFFEKLPEVKNIRILKSKDKYIITWESDQNMFKVLDKTKDEVKLVKNKFFTTNRCGSYIIFTTNGILDSKGVEINPCK